MQSVNDDMDDLWRKAGSEYPLNTSGADWDKVAAGLGIPLEPKRKDRRALWLLLLLLIPVVCMRPFPLGLGSDTLRSSTNAPSAGSKRSETTSSSAEQDAPDRISTEPAPAGRPDQLPATTGEQAASNTSADHGGLVTTANNTVAGAPGAATVTTGRDAPGTPSAAANGARNKPRSKSSSSATRVQIASGARQPALDRKRRHQSKSTSTTASAVPQQAGAGSPALTGADPKQVLKNTDSSHRPGLSPVLQPRVPKGDSIGKVVAAASDTARKSDSATAASEPKKVKSKRSRGFYAGAVVGTGFTTIKRQRSPGLGYDLGIAVGYQVSRHFSIEAQVLWSRKKYFSHGKYLKNDLSYLPQYSYVRAVDGDCRMFEIPINVQYHFRFRKRGNWFAAGGFSSYLMKREEYGYDVKNLMTTYEGHYDTTLRNATRDWMALLQISAGYRFALRRNFTLRIEPYIQLPLSEAGAGRLPLTSYGLRVGLLKNIF